MAREGGLIFVKGEIMKTLKIHIKNCIVKVPKTWYTYVSKGALSIGAIKFWDKVARGVLIFVKCPRPQYYILVALGQMLWHPSFIRWYDYQLLS